MAAASHGQPQKAAATSPERRQKWSAAPATAGAVASNDKFKVPSSKFQVHGKSAAGAAFNLELETWNLELETLRRGSKL
jgi:hypothetical protein